MTKPKQFNFLKEWNTSIKLIRGRPKVVAGMDRVAKRWFELAEFARDEKTEFDAIQAEAEFNLDLMTFAVKHWDLYWQQKWTEPGGDTLTDLSLGIAETLFPNQKWEILDYDSYEVVVDSERTTVFDIHNFDRLPAGASLLLAQDPKYQPDEIDHRAATAYLEGINAKLRDNVKQVKELIEFANAQRDGNVVAFKN